MAIHRLPRQGGVWQFMPPRAPKRQPNHRLFTQNSQLLLVSRTKLRPQLPFLHPVTGGRTAQGLESNNFRLELTRLLTTERKQAFKYQVRLFGKYTLIIWTMFGLLFIVRSAIAIDRDDIRYPSPLEWSFWTRSWWRLAKETEEGDEKTGFVNWPGVGDCYVNLLTRLEDPSIDGAGIQPILKEAGDIFVAGVGKAGLDISAKPETWRRGYFNALMGMARAAENTENMVKDIKRRMAFPADAVIGPSNPHPKPLHQGAAPAPLEEDCKQAFESPHVYYSKVLTTYGFTNAQRLEAALAYADWLDFKDLTATAEDVYDWGLDIAMGGFPQGANHVVDAKTGIISKQAEYISSNLLMATTALASFHARHGNLAAALPIFVSVLRARKSLPEPSAQGFAAEKPAGTWSMMTDLLGSLFSRRPYPPPPENGDELPLRSKTSVCEEAGIMSNIGEILYASTIFKSLGRSTTDVPAGRSIPTMSTSGHLENQQDGLSWTRQAVDLAEATLESAAREDKQARAKCSECLDSAMENWAVMVEGLLKNERAAKSVQDRKPKRNWFWGFTDSKDENKWERESLLVQQRLKKVRKVLAREEKHREEKDFYHALVGK